MDHRYITLALFAIVTLSSKAGSSTLSHLAAARLRLAATTSDDQTAGNSTVSDQDNGLHDCREFYIHDILNGTEAGMEASAYLIARPAEFFANNFGAILVMDDKITIHPDYNTTEIGRAQGTYTVVNHYGSPELLYEFAAVFNGGEKICFFGHRPIDEPSSELAAFSCGGHGKLTQGITLARFSAVYFSPSGLNEIIRVVMCKFI
ncbi:dirigent protein 21-like [Selaginella moellendorffii]|uniref:dirigent protein 21-like n=1 Tax=Selaginella moellendorffii TaxID=88036 RepID=UPI000D1CA491|nr:dirigent protein 21-like [Selaginella moellendorffii]|eukprot:XP_024537795.1 dirigent protein 21-like [Selaginella moellendorffii]